MKRRTRGRRRRRNSRLLKKRILIISGAVVAVALIAFLTVYFMRSSAVNKVAEDRIWNNIYIEGIDVSGMNETEAKKILTAHMSKYKSEKVILLAEEQEIEMTLQELGFKADNMEQLVKEAISYGKKGSVWSRYDQLKDLEKTKIELDLKYVIDIKTVETMISEKLPNLEKGALDATIKREDGKFVITDDQVGKKVDMEASISAIEKCFNADWEPKGTETIALVIVSEQPKVTKAQLEEIQDVLGTYSTNYSTGGPRGLNVENATTRIGGRLLMPGEELSTSEAMGSRTEENGYYGAGAYQGGEVVESLGGGVCQVATTLYNAVLLAELEVTERHAHSMIVGYAEPSGDATIAEGYKDLKFKNNLDTPIFVEGIASKGKVTFNIYGKETRPSTRVIKYEGEIVSDTPAKKVFSQSNDPLGTITTTFAGYPARKATLWKIVEENGVEVSREEVCKSTYKTKNATVTVGVSTTNAAAKKLVTDAIATQDEAKINAAIAEAKKLITPSTPTVQTPTTTPETPPPEEPEDDVPETETGDDVPEDGTSDDAQD